MKPNIENLQKHQGKRVFVSYVTWEQAAREGLYQILMRVDLDGVLMDIVPGRHIYLHFGDIFPQLKLMVSTEGELLFEEFKK